MEEIAERISKILEYYNLNAAAFADKIGVQRSGLSHILTGRNKPSLDFIIKITEAFEAVDLNWLVHGQGSFPKNKTADKPKTLDPAPVKLAPTPLPDIVEKIIENKVISSKSELEKIVFFYRDGTFSEFISK